MTAITTNITATANTHSAGNFFGKLANMMAAHKTRKDLKNLSEAQLVDIGITAEEAAAEASRPFWDAPSNWANKPRF